MLKLDKMNSLLKVTIKISLFIVSTLLSERNAQAQCDPNNLYDAITCAYHQSIALRSDGTYSCWGQLMGDTATAVLSPQDINVANYPALTGSSILAATASAGSGSSEQSVLLTTAGLFAWGTEGVIINNSITSSSTFQKLTINGQTNGLPVGVSPSDIIQLFATNKTLAFVTSSGICYVLNASTGASILGDNSATVDAAWHKVLTAAGTPLTNVVAVRGQFVSATKNALMALTDDGTTRKVYTWGASTYLGNSSAAAVKSFATQMTLPAGLNVKMIGCTGGNSATRNNTYFVLGTSGELHSLGANDMRQCGDRTTTERTAWVRVKRPNNTNFNDVKYISVQEHDAKVPAGALITNAGDLYVWGESDGMMLGVSVDGAYNPFLPGGFTSGADVAKLVELGGHTTVYMRENSAKFCYVGHRVNGSMGDGTTTDTNEPVFNCSSTPVLNICGSTGWDYGDAPVNFENGGGSNLALNFYVEEEFTLYLGTTSPADGDETTQNVIIGTDNNGAFGDGIEENAVASFPAMAVSNTSYSITIPVKNNTGINANVYAWIDWNNNFTFESTEFAGATVTTNANSQNVTLNWTGISGIENGRRYIRIRISTFSLTNNAATQVDERSLGFLADGEIEDFNIIISDPTAPANISPQTNNVTNGSVIQATDGPLPIDDFSSSDSDGTVVACRITSLPAHGTLYIFDGVVLIPVVINQAMSTATAESLFYDPNLTWNGSDSFTYASIDNDGSEDSTPATYFLAQCVNDADGDGICDQNEIPGCQDLAACNYNPLATDSNGSCVSGSTYFADADSDGFGNPSSTIQSCTAPTGYVTNNTDCNDSNASLNSVSTEICGNGIDEDCNGSDLACFAVPGCTDVSACNYNASAAVSDGSCTYANTWYLDADGDGYYISTSLSCTSPGANYNTVGGVNGDCNDTNAAVYPGATEVCNSIDDDCDTQIDEGVQNTYYLDVDGDGYGAAASSVLACTLPAGYVINNLDCNDVNSAVNPTTIWYLDVDADGYYVSTNMSCTSPGANYNTTVGTNGDCNDANAAVHAGVIETCNGSDDDCDGLIDENASNTY
jgi:lipid-binding SYLF domain-containing protein